MHFCKYLIFILFFSVALPGWTQVQVVELLKDINPQSSSSEHNFMSESNGKLFISANDDSHGIELWVSDGTESGTQLLKDIYPGPSSSDAGWNNHFASCNGKLFFIACHNGPGTSTLWITDGTNEGTHQVLNDSLLHVINKELFVYNEKVYFSGYDGDPAHGPQCHGHELWCSDGTEESTYMVKDIRPNDTVNYGVSGSDPERFCEFNGLLYFMAYDGPQGVNGGHSGELWVTDGTEEGTHLVKDIAQVNLTARPEHLTVCDDKLFFTTDDGIHGIELWVTDGTEEGTHLVKDIYPGINQFGNPNNSTPSYLTNLNGTLFFLAHVNDGSYLWKSDGTEEGTVNLSAQANIHFPINLKPYGDMLVFLAYENEDNWEPYSWTESEGVQLIKEINPATSGGLPGIDFNPMVDFPEGFVEYKNKLYFRAAKDGFTTTMWQTDGTEEGTVVMPGQENFPIPDPVSPAYISEFTFIVNDGSLYYPAAYDQTGVEVYKYTDNTVEINELPVSTLQIYPNPTNDELSIKLNNSESGLASLTILDATGQTIVEKTFIDKINLNVSSYPGGVYFVKIKTGTFNEVHKIVIK